jgi:two-component system, chemotaxis family, protein-glutamate methylesterase/glutaminase
MMATFTEPRTTAACGLTCPECNAALFLSQRDPLLQFRCRVGHTFSAQSLLSDQSDTLERTLWSSVNAIEERAALIRMMAEQLRKRGEIELAKLEETKAQDANSRAERIRQMLVEDGDW